jgi:putative salt-induced outer membrane protein YdiY
MTVEPARATVSVSVLSFVGLAWFQAAVGDEVIMTNGDRMTGRILQTNQESVLLQTAYAGTIAIERGQVQSLHRARPRASPMAGEPADANAVTVAAGSKPNDRNDIAAPPEDQSSVTAHAGSAQPSPFTPGSKLSGRVNFSLKDEKGNTEKSEIDFDYQVEYRQGWHRLRSFGALEFDTNDTEKTTDKWATFNQYSRLFPSRWYGAAWIALQHDRFSDLRLQTVGGPAVGYLVFESDALNLAVETGPAVLGEDFYGQPDEDSLGLAWFLRYDQLIWQDRLQPYHRQFGYAALDGDDKQLWQSWTGLRVPLAGGFTGSVEFEYDYDSDPAVEAKTTDTTLRLKLGYQW